MNDGSGIGGGTSTCEQPMQKEHSPMDNILVKLGQELDISERLCNRLCKVRTKLIGPGSIEPPEMKEQGAEPSPLGFIDTANFLTGKLAIQHQKAETMIIELENI